MKLTWRRRSTSLHSFLDEANLEKKVYLFIDNPNTFGATWALLLSNGLKCGISLNLVTN